MAYREDNLNAHLTYITTCGAQLVDKSVFYPSQTSPAAIHRPEGMEGFVGLGGKSEPEIWSRVHVTANASDCATMSLVRYL